MTFLKTTWDFKYFFLFKMFIVGLTCSEFLVQQNKTAIVLASATQHEAFLTWSILLEKKKTYILQIRNSIYNLRLQIRNYSSKD